MKLGQALFWTGIIAGLIFAAKNPETGKDFSDMILPFFLAFIASAVGSVIWRQAIKKENHSRHSKGLSLSAINKKVLSSQDAVLKLSHGPIVWETLTNSVDAILATLAQVVDSKEALASELTIAKLASIMSDLARAERYLNRTWSMASDGFLKEDTIMDLLKESHYSLEQVVNRLAEDSS